MLRTALATFTVLTLTAGGGLAQTSNSPGNASGSGSNTAQTAPGAGGGATLPRTPPSGTGMQPGQSAPDTTAAAPPNLCRELVAFLQQNPAQPAAQPKITLEEVQRFARDDNRYACRTAVHGLRSAGAQLPPSLLDAIGQQ